MLHGMNLFIAYKTNYNLTEILKIPLCLHEGWINTFMCKKLI